MSTLSFKSTFGIKVSANQLSPPSDIGLYEREVRPHIDPVKHAQGIRYVWITFDGRGQWYETKWARSVITKSDAQLSKLQREILDYLTFVEKKEKSTRRKRELQGFGIPWSTKEFLKIQGLDSRTSGTVSDSIHRLHKRGLVERQQVGSLKPRTTHVRLTELARQLGWG
jgi:DNA-binding MarR family transcriptional regulator